MKHGYPKTALVCNRKGSVHGVNAADAEAEFDSPETIEAIRRVIEGHGVDIITLEADETLPQRLKEEKIEFVFNLAEGKGGRGREAQVPALLELCGIPYMGSDATVMAVSLDKDMCKRLAASYGVRVGKGVVISPETKDFAKAVKDLSYPLIIKPNAEGSGKGIFENGIAENEAELEERLTEIFEKLPCDMLVEEYLSGREFTVGVLGNGENAHVFKPMEIIYHHNTQRNYTVYSYEIKKDYRNHVEYKCPAELTAAEEKEMMDAAKRIFMGLGCSDISRIDFRMNQKGEACFLELNPLPGLAPDYSDFPMTAESENIGYDELVFRIYVTALKRLGLYEG